MRANVLGRFRRRLCGGQPLLGTWLTLGSPPLAEHLGRQGFDWLGVELDAADGACTTDSSIRVLRSMTAIPFVRVPRDDVGAIKRARELGAGCVLLSKVETRADAEYLVEALECDTAAPNDRAASIPWIDGAGSDIGDDDRPLRAVVIETARGLECAEAVLSVPGVEACFIFLGDPQSGFEGVPPGLADQLRRAQAICRARGIAPGIQVRNAEQAARRIAEGWRLVGVGSDGDLVTHAAANVRRTILDRDAAPLQSEATRGYEAGCAMLGPLGSSSHLRR